MADQTLKILVKAEGDMAGLDKAKKGLEDLKGATTSAVTSAAALGGVLGAAIPTTFIGAMSTVIRMLKELEAEQDQWVDGLEKARERIQGLQQGLLTTQEGLNKLAQIKTQPLTQQIAELEQELIRLKTEQLLVNQALEGGVEAAAKYQAQIQATTTAVEALKNMQKGAVQALRDAEAVTFAEAFGGKADIERAKREQLINQILARHRATGTEISRGQAEQLANDKLRADEQNRIRAEVEHEATVRDSITPMLRDQATMLQNIRQNQQLISEAPFMGADEKQAALLSSSRLEMRNIAQAIEATQAALKGSGLDATQYEQLEGRLQQLRFRFRQLGQDMQAMSFGGGLRAELTSWANSFGTTAQQVGKTIEATIGASLQSVNQLLVTGKFDAQALLQQLVLLGLQLVEQMILQRIMAAINAAASVGQAAATGPAVAALWAPAATAATIATQGAAALQAPASVATALALIQGMLVVGHEGGAITRRMRRFHNGGLSADEVPIIAQEGEIMIRRDVAQAPGMTDFLLGLNAGAFHRGGPIRKMHDGGGVWTWHINPQGEWIPVQLPPPAYGIHDIPGGDEPLLPAPGGGGRRGGGGRGGGKPDWTKNPPGAGPLSPEDLERVLEKWGEGEFTAENFRVLQQHIGATGGVSFGGSGLPAGGSFFHQMPGVAGGPLPGWRPSFGGGGGPTNLTMSWRRPGAGPWGISGWIGGKGGEFGGGPRFNVRKFHGGGAIGGIAGGGGGMPGVHIYAFTDLKQLTKHMASRDGQKIIFDTVKGRRIDLGMK